MGRVRKEDARSRSESFYIEGNDFDDAIDLALNAPARRSDTREWAERNAGIWERSHTFRITVVASGKRIAGRPGKG